MTHLDLITFEELPEPLRASLTKRTLLRLGAQSRFPRHVRLAPHAAPMWRRSDVDAFIASKLAELETSA